MPGFDVSQLSSNWKKLQGKLQAEKKEESHQTGSKRKRPEENGKNVNGVKKAKLVNGAHKAPRKIRRMGLFSSKPTEERDGGRKEYADLISKHGISQEDISNAYGKTNGTASSYKDEINGGHHPTHKVGKFIALDCEMVGTGPPPHADNVLARVSLVNFQGEQIYDSYVLPRPGIEVNDYRTRYSGITESHMREGFARPLAEVQKDIANLLDGRILIGHGLHNDLDVLLLSHPKRDLRDTSRYPKFKFENGGRPPALRYLARDKLGMEIQTGEHSSIEDARAAMMLFKMEKTGFEEENRKRFGQRTRVDAKGTKKGRFDAIRDQSVDDDGEVETDEDEEADLELLHGEDDEVKDEEASASIPRKSTAKKKRKNKKRTKRK